jgi:hypothetical protein
MALSVRIGFEEREAVQSAKKLGKSIEDVDKALDSMAKEGDSAFDKLAKDSKTAGNKVGKNLKSGFDEAKKEAGQSGRESAASFSGGFDDVGDFVQETFANALAGFGPVGAAAGVALAAVLGTAMSAAVDAQERLAEAREAAVELASTMYENGGELPITARVQELFSLLAKERSARNPLEKLANDYLDLGTNIEMVKDAASAANLPVAKFIRALTGSDLTLTKESLKAINKELDRIGQERGDFTEITGRRDALTGLKVELEGVVKQSELASELYSSTEFLKAKQVEDLSAAVDDVSQSWRDASIDAGDYFGTVEGGVVAFDWSTYLSNAETVLAQANEYKRKIVLLPSEIQEEGNRLFAEQGAAAALQYVTSYEGASAADQGRFVAVAAANGAAAGQAEGEALANSAHQAAKARAAGLESIYLKVVAQDATEYGSLRSQIARNLGTFSPPVVLGPGIGRVWDG